MDISEPRGSSPPLEGGVHVDEPDAWQTYPEYNDEVYDAITSAKLDPNLIAVSRAEEMNFLRDLGTCTVEKKSECLAATGRPPLPSGWVDVNKGDAVRPALRSRWVVKETKHVTSMDTGDPAQTFSATPPYECLRMMISMTMSPRGARRTSS